MRALLLAAGLGTRLYPVTQACPKCLVPIAGQPLLYFWLTQLYALGIREFHINVHHFPQQVHDAIDAFLARQLNPKLWQIHLHDESELLGTLGTLQHNIDNLFRDDLPLLVAHADNLVSADWRSFYAAHQQRESTLLATIMTFDCDVPQQCGIVETDEHQRLLGFHEKVENPPSHRANGAIYWFSRDMLPLIKQAYSTALNAQQLPDLSLHLLPLLLERAKCWHNTRYLRDIGTPESYQKGQMYVEQHWPDFFPYCAVTSTDSAPFRSSSTAANFSPEYSCMSDSQRIASIYRDLLLIRETELEVAKRYPTDVIKSPVHLSLGQEFISVALCRALQRDDVVSATYRGHAAYLAKGGNLDELIAELYGKSTGCAQGRGGSMHLVAPEVNFVGTSAVVGTSIPVALGHAFTQKYLKTGNVVVCFVGDGATEEGAFYESLNFAGLHKLPIIFVIENNEIAIHQPLSKRWADASLLKRCEGFGVELHDFPGNTNKRPDDVLALHTNAQALVAKVRETSQPILLQTHCFRWFEHVGPNKDFDQGYREEAPWQAWRDNDPVLLLGQQLSAEEKQVIDAQVHQKIADAFDKAERAPFPPASQIQQYAYAQAETSPQLVSPDVLAGSRTLTYVEALNEGQRQALQEDSNAFLFGLDVDDHKGIQGTTLGLVDEFGPERVFTTPLSEDAMTGLAIGAAMSGLKPIHVHIRMDFLLLCMNQLINMGAKMHYMFAGSTQVPMVVRAIIGKSWGQGAQHSQGLHSLFMHIPGLRVVAPSNAYDAKGLMLSAVDDPNPVIFVEHRLLYNTDADVPSEPYRIELGKANIVRQSKSQKAAVTLVAISNMVMESLRAATLLADAGIEVEVIDPVTLKPLDVETIQRSAETTGRLLVVDNAWLGCGASAEIIASVTERSEQAIRVKRIGFTEITCPTTPSLEVAFYPNPISIAKAAMAMIDSERAEKWQPDEAQAQLVYQQKFRGPF